MKALTLTSLIIVSTHLQDEVKEVCTRGIQYIKLLAEGDKQSFQYASWRLQVLHTSIMVMAIYRPPGQSAINFLADFTDWLTENLLQGCNSIILGDFNLHLNDMNSDDTMNLRDTMDVLGLVQHVNFATHSSGNILDHIYTEEASSVKIIQCSQSEYISDHRIIDCKNYTGEKNQLLIKKSYIVMSIASILKTSWIIYHLTMVALQCSRQW